jgi:hypothetical protein
LRENAAVHHSKIDRRMSATGHERPICDGGAMSASPPKASKSPSRTEWRKGAKKVPAASAVDALGIVKKP